MITLLHRLNAEWLERGKKIMSIRVRHRKRKRSAKIKEAQMRSADKGCSGHLFVEHSASLCCKEAFVPLTPCFFPWQEDN